MGKRKKAQSHSQPELQSVLHTRHVDVFLPLSQDHYIPTVLLLRSLLRNFRAVHSRILLRQADGFPAESCTSELVSQFTTPNEIDI